MTRRRVRIQNAGDGLGTSVAPLRATPFAPWISLPSRRTLRSGRCGSGRRAGSRHSGGTMEAQITVRSLSSGRVLARIEPLGPEIQADSVEDAVVAAQSAHQWYLS